MKITIKLFSVLLAGLLMISFVTPVVYAAYPGMQEPSYAKWGRLAVFETGKRYPDYQIVDYSYLGRNLAQNGDNVERFKLWLRKGAAEKGVVITITLTPQRIFKHISFQETTR
ncbi:DUF3889 domain-containing protein [Fictibacillus barbaricus]|uniref:DUF3889 domain-containing protein n=1 Tax=Fictibacillus barbaricus TaxID=182136 RepID=A0ABU1TZK7_9BACL|nr:DUF3889 domain-containing protein [Fictibacillus barbaricus]MDR7072644.1 hypothetical protein [Fictibacillus barbaricus]